MSNNIWDADPEKYAKLAEPMNNQEEALLNAKGFLTEVRRLREKYHLPELIVQYAIYFRDGDARVGVSGGAGWGNQVKQLQLAKMCLDRELDSLASIVDKIGDSIPRLPREMITDPKAEKSEVIGSDNQE